MAMLPFIGLCLSIMLEHSRLYNYREDGRRPDGNYVGPMEEWQAVFLWDITCLESALKRVQYIIIL